MIAHFYNLIFYQPLFNALIFLYDTVGFGNMGLAIIFLTILIRLLLFPIFQKSVRHQTIMQKLQPKLESIQREHKSNKEKQFKATMELYKEHEINPFSGFLLLLLQLPILIALYRIFLTKLTPETLQGLYSFVAAPQNPNYSFFGLINLEQGSIVMVGLAAAVQYIQGMRSLPKIEAGREMAAAEKVNRQMIYLAPAITFIIFLKLPAAIGLYWIVSSLFSILQQEIVNRQYERSGKSGQNNN